MSDKEKYSADNIRSLKWDEAIRKRPGMYIRRVDSKGFIDMLKGILSSILFYDTNADEFTIELLENKSAKIKFNNIQNDLIDNWSKWNPNPNNLFHLELQTLNALSENFKISFFDSEENKIIEQVYAKGKLTEGNSIEKITCKSIEIDFDLDEEIWGEGFKWNVQFLTHELREFAYLYKSVKFKIKYKVDEEECKIVYHFKNGLKDRIDIEEMNGIGGSYFETVIDEKIGDFHIEVAFAFREYTVDQPFLKSYVNDFYTSENGSHVDGFLKGLTYGVMKYFQKYELTESFKISEKGMRENLIAALNIKMEEPLFSGCVKNKLANSEIIEPIAEYVAELLFKKIEEDEESTKKLIRKFEI